jgi:RNA-directed DNA polymerase
LTLSVDKMRLIEFGRFAAEARARRGLGKPETFQVLGFTHLCGKSRGGRFLLPRHTARTRMREGLTQIKVTLRRIRRRIALQGRWLGRLVTGDFADHAVPADRHAPRPGAHRIWRTIAIDLPHLVTPYRSFLPAPQAHGTIHGL